MEPTRIDTFLGENNLLPEQKLTTKDGSFVRSAVNVDLSDAGTLRRRNGTLAVRPATFGRSMCHESGRTLFLDAGSLREFFHETNEAVTLLTGLSATREMRYTSLGDTIFCTNGERLLSVTKTEARDLCIQTPAGVPEAVVTEGGGSLPKGIYRGAASFVAADGRESCLTDTFTAEVFADGGAISLSGIPQLVNHLTVVYMTMVNGVEMYRHIIGAASTADITVAPDGFGVSAGEIPLRPLPPGVLITALNGRLYTAAGSRLYYSEPNDPGRYDPTSGFIDFPEPITILASCVNGLYIVADCTYWLRGDPSEAVLQNVLPTRAMFGSDSKNSIDTSVFWMSGEGFVLANAEGVVNLIQKGNFAPPVGKAGASFFREVDGERRLVVSIMNSEVNPMVSRTYMEAEIVRKEDQ